MPIDDILAESPDTTYGGAGQQQNQQRQQSSTSASGPGMTLRIGDTSLDLSMSREDAMFTLNAIQAAALIYIAWKL